MRLRGSAISTAWPLWWADSAAGSGTMDRSQDLPSDSASAGANASMRRLPPSRAPASASSSARWSTAERPISRLPFSCNVFAPASSTRAAWFACTTWPSAAISTRP